MNADYIKDWNTKISILTGTNNLVGTNIFINKSKNLEKY